MVDKENGGHGDAVNEGVHGVARDRTDGLVEHVLEGFALYRLVDVYKRQHLHWF